MSCKLYIGKNNYFWHLNKIGFFSYLRCFFWQIQMREKGWKQSDDKIDFQMNFLAFLKWNRVKNFITQNKKIVKLLYPDINVVGDG